MTGEVVYSCDSCGAEFRVRSETRPTVICSDCNVTTTPQDDRKAIAAYRVGYVRYQEGRRQLTAGLERFDDKQWTHARALFAGGSEAFETAVEQFRSAANQSQRTSLRTRIETGRKKSSCYWQVADWLSGTAYARENDDRARASHFRSEAEAELEHANEFGRLLNPEQLMSETGVDVPDAQEPTEVTRERSETTASTADTSDRSSS